MHADAKWRAFPRSNELPIVQTIVSSTRRLKDQPLPVSRATGKLLYLLARSIRARNIVEFGTSFGISTLHLAAALRDNGGGRLIGSEFEPSKILRARENLAAGGLSDLVEVREGDALETLARDLPDSIDFVLLDGAKNFYPSILSLLEGRLRAGALLVADNADACPEYLARVRSTAHGYLSVPFADDVELSMRLDGGPPERCRATCICNAASSLRQIKAVSSNFAGFRPKGSRVSAKASQRVSTRCQPVDFPRTVTYLRKAIRVQSPDTTIELEELRPAAPILPRKHFRFVIRPGEPIVQMAAPCYAEAHANRRDFHETFFFLALASLRLIVCALRSTSRASCRTKWWT